MNTYQEPTAFPPTACEKCGNGLDRNGECPECLWWDGGLSLAWFALRAHGRA